MFYTVKGVSMKLKNNKISFILLLFLPILNFATGGGKEPSLTHNMMVLVFQIGIILFAARFGGKLFEKIKMPSVLGELVAGIIIGPYVLGQIALPGFPHGLFGDFIFQVTQATGKVPALPVSVELYSIATIASILLLFFAGLETDLDLFIRFSVAGLVIGISGVIFSFFFGAILGVLFLKLPLMHPVTLFLGVMSIATSVGITAQILSKKKKMDSPEGVSILAAAVIDDIIGIIILAVVIGIAGAGVSGNIDWGAIGGIALKAIVVWLAFSIMGILLANKISRLLKKAKNKTVISVLSFGLALIIAGVFEQAGLAMIIGAYIVGLSLSKTDLNYVIQEKLHTMHDFFVPIFFVIMGMLVDVRVFLDGDILIFGLVYSVSAIFAKYIGGVLPSFLLKFNFTGAHRIGLGMIPRGEVALIIAGIGISSGILDEKVFGAAIMMTLVTTMFAPPFLNLSLGKNKRGTRKEITKGNTQELDFDFPSEELTDFLLTKILRSFSDEDFFVNLVDMDERLYSIRKENMFITLIVDKVCLHFTTEIENISLIQTLVYEAIITTNNDTEKLKEIAKPEKLRKQMAASQGEVPKINLNLSKILCSSCMSMNLKSSDKNSIILELIDLLDKQEKINNKEMAINDVLARETIMSTGMQEGLAIPHARTEAVDEMVVGIGLKKEGIDFESLDGKLSRIFFMILSPKNNSGPHIQILAVISSILNNDIARDKLFKCKSSEEIKDYLIKKHKEITKKKKK